jgi:type I restriction enzyme S subunit
MAGKYQAYPEYKTTSVQWLGEIPKHWQRKRIKETAKLINGYPFDSKRFEAGKGTPLVRIRDIKAAKTEVGFVGDVPPESLINSGDVLIGMDGDFNVSLWSGGEAALNQRVACIRAENYHLQKFIYYVLPFNMKVVNDLTYFTTVKHLSSFDILKTVYTLPPIEELRKIVHFLDHETAKIDNLIDKQQQLITLLKEKRQAVISHAVTKGFNPNAPMRDSGVEWLGEVPAHWMVSKIKQVAKLESGHTPDKKVEAYWVDCNIPWVSLNDSTQLKQVDYISETAFYLNAKGMENSSARELPARCVVFTRDASIGLAAITTKVMAVSQHVIAWVCDENKVIPEYLLLVFYAMEDELNRYTSGATLKTIGLPDVNKLSGAFPHIKEQSNIAKSVFSEMKKFDLLINKAEAAIGIIRERRTALISAAVTGKIDVRNWQAPQASNNNKEVAV